MEKLAIHGGEKVKTTPFGSGKRFAGKELAYLKEALEQETLFYWSGRMVKEFVKKYTALCGVKYGVACSSGTAAIHIALGAVGVSAGDEVITSPITDMGTVIGILYQNAIPVFADLDPLSHNMSPADIARKITPKTKAIVVVHLSGNAADMDPIMELARKHGLKVIEDCAQSYMCYYKGRIAGTIGDIGCFSLNDFKHISAGDGGICVTNDEELFRRARYFADKGYDREGGVKAVQYLCPNYRMTELQGAVALAQLEKLEWICSRRNSFGDALTSGIKSLPGIIPPKVCDGGKSSYWAYMFRIDEKAAKVSRDEFSRALAAEGIPNTAGYIPTCIYEYDIFAKRNAYPGSALPFTINHGESDITYRKGLCPVAEKILSSCIRVPVSEFYTDRDLLDVIKAISKVSMYYAAR